MLDSDSYVFRQVRTYGEIAVPLRSAANASTAAGIDGSDKGPSCTVVDIVPRGRVDYLASCGSHSAPPQLPNLVSLCLGGPRKSLPKQVHFAFELAATTVCRASKMYCYTKNTCIVRDFYCCYAGYKLF